MLRSAKKKARLTKHFDCEHTKTLTADNVRATLLQSRNFFFFFIKIEQKKKIKEKVIRLLTLQSFLFRSISIYRTTNERKKKNKTFFFFL